MERRTDTDELQLRIPVVAVGERPILRTVLLTR